LIRVETGCTYKVQSAALRSGRDRSISSVSRAAVERRHGLGSREAEEAEEASVQ
jgi:hypothetical protein